ncbi:MAG: DUF4136 domain-containing protein [Gammaproteobacteria bacterium]|nr:DUF4136 domain-containing protein [Gammaproteobacteria bacterium]
MIRFPAYLTLVLGLGACATTPNIDSLYDTEVDFSVYKTFTFAESQSEETVKYSTLMDKFIKSAISNELLARGYKQSDKPDLLVNYHVNSKEKADIYGVPKLSLSHYRYIYGYTPWPYYTTDIRVRRYTEGTLNIDLVDAEKKQLVWEGVFIDKVRKNTMDDLKQRINHAVKLVFEEYPFRAGEKEPAAQRVK